MVPFTLLSRSLPARKGIIKFSSLSSSMSSIAGIGFARKINVNGVQIHCVTTTNNGSAYRGSDNSRTADEEEQKPALLCMPGCLGGAEADFAPQLRGLCDAFQVVSYDPRGYGQSRPPLRDFPLDFYQRDADDAAEVMRALGHERYSVMGFSDGAISAVMLAAKAARIPTTLNQQKDDDELQLVEKLIIFGGSAYFSQEDAALWNESRDVSEWAESDRERHFATYGHAFESMWSAAVDAWVDMANRNGGNVCMDHAKSITCPTLVLHGAKDPFVVMDHPQWFANNIPGNGNTRLHVFPTGAHTIQHDCADEFNQLVREFLLSE
mmetsp:Transcript_10999/g.16099  ORF Transcript_10999/g.16099 Transcript_10999/m.16099 type:complete len:323 (-) Transcript_10999:325-1293(-)